MSFRISRLRFGKFENESGNRNLYEISVKFDASVAAE